MRRIAALFLVLCCGCQRPSPPPTPQTTVPSVPVRTPGRFVPVAPPGGTDAFVNYLWVVDTATGHVAGYRFVTDMKDKDAGWWISEVPGPRTLKEAGAQVAASDAMWDASMPLVVEATKARVAEQAQPGGSQTGP